MAPGAATTIGNRIATAAAALAVAVCLAPAARASGGFGTGPLELGRVVPAPAGAGSLCADLPWACARVAARIAGSDVLAAVETVNRAVNRRHPAISDRRRFGREDHWAELGPRGGDCEDFALTKMRELLRAGVASRDLRVATVLDHDRQPHAVLVVTAGGTDLVLDNLTDRILPWDATGYVFLRMQDRDDRRLWRIVRGAQSLASL